MKLYVNDVLQSLDGFTGKGTSKDRKIVPFTTHSWLSRKVLLIHEDGFQLKTVSLLRERYNVSERLFSIGSYQFIRLIHISNTPNPHFRTLISFQGVISLILNAPWYANPSRIAPLYAYLLIHTDSRENFWING